MNTETIERPKATTANSSNRRASRASKQIGWAVKLHVTYEYTRYDNGKQVTATDYQWVQGATKAATLANAITEKARQQTFKSTTACWIESEMFPVTKPIC